VLASPLCITNCSCTFSFVSGDIFCTAIVEAFNYYKFWEILDSRALFYFFGEEGRNKWRAIPLT